LRELDARNAPVQFDEREEETEPSQTGLRRAGENLTNCHREAKLTAPLLDSTQNPVRVHCERIRVVTPVKDSTFKFWWSIRDETMSAPTPEWTLVVPPNQGPGGKDHIHLVNCQYAPLQVGGGLRDSNLFISASRSFGSCLYCSGVSIGFILASDSRRVASNLA